MSMSFWSFLSAWSLSARRAWIEISISPGSWILPPVALRKESVDRNTARGIGGQHVIVALRKESVDRNIMIAQRCPILWVALRKESVDRNILTRCVKIIGDSRSPQGERG